LHEGFASLAPIALSGGFEECAMSTVGASNNNPYANIQALWQRGKGQSSAAQGDGASQAFAMTGPQATNVTSSPTVAASSGAAATSGGKFPRFEPQTLQALLAAQTTSGNQR
jgi:hypothetical protein